MVVFQPHLYSRTQDFANEFAVSLSQADDLVLLDIYPAREKPIVGVDSNMLLEICSNPRKEVCSKEELIVVLKIIVDFFNPLIYRIKKGRTINI